MSLRVLHRCLDSMSPCSVSGSVIVSRYRYTISSGVTVRLALDHVKGPQQQGGFHELQTTSQISQRIPKFSGHFRYGHPCSVSNNEFSESANATEPARMENSKWYLPAENVMRGQGVLDRVLLL